MTSFAGEPFKDFIPPGEFIRLSPLIDNVRSQWPWPFSDSEWQAITAHLPPSSHSIAGKKIVWIARVYLGNLWAEKSGPHGKPNPVSEVRAVLEAAERLLAELKNLSDDGGSLLQSLSFQPSEGFDYLKLRLEVDRFLHERRIKRERLGGDTSDRRGRPANKVLGNFLIALRRIFVEAQEDHSRRASGFPDFRTTVLTPLERFGHIRVERKALESAENTARKRSPKNSASSG